MKSLDDVLYKIWWYAVSYGASSERRMFVLDKKRDEHLGF